MRRRGRYNGAQVYKCQPCDIRYVDRPHVLSGNPYCVACRVQLKKAVQRYGYQCFRCRKCGVFFRDGKSMGPEKPINATPEVREARRQQAAQLDAGLLDMIKAALPGNVPLDLREDVIQESALAALSGDFDLSELGRMVSHCRRRVHRMSENGFQLVSLDQPIPNTNGLTYGDTIAG
jgi:ribosomal protein L37AE/L43A